MAGMNIQKAVEKYVSESKSVKDCLRAGLVNYSALSRQISKELRIPASGFDAVLVACRRYGDKLRRTSGAERAIRKLLKDSKLEIKNKVGVVVVERDVFFGNVLEVHKEAKRRRELFRVVEGVDAITVITNSAFVPRIREVFRNKIIKISDGLVEVMLRSPEELEEVPGVMAYLFSLFGERGINIVETMSCWTDTIFVVEEKDLENMMGVLRF
ncbi:ACT domain-containing protein [Candidatus Woesearchaeota archaeon]|nr:ACT domain-containing protein [Candidatus Woesearchaeota archaeon]